MDTMEKEYREFEKDMIYMQAIQTIELPTLVKEETKREDN